MEFLIIAFIIISIVSSLSKNIRKQMKKEAPFDPWSFDVDSESSKKDVEVLPEEPEGEEEFVEEEPEPAVDVTASWESLPETFYGEQPVREVDSLAYKEMEEEVITPPLPEQKKESLELQEAGKPEDELKALLTGRKLPLAIIASEVLGSPRAANLSVYYRSSRMARKHF